MYMDTMPVKYSTNWDNNQNIDNTTTRGKKENYSSCTRVPTLTDDSLYYDTRSILPK